ncbi:hypothetical protein F383_21153 [Gossypium arboreum]|uniref:Uncharacterized protein n=1 Tax=Gossypium arboreum TaxID=29729 RepID=A0A0B0MN13_GOSAR|nr:hypothetical protein F383_21153 [Gossypium arboreum]
MVLHVNQKLMPTSQMWSYTTTHIGILCSYGAFGRRNSIDLSS